MSTIPRNATVRIAALKTELTSCRVYTLANYFAGEDVSPEHAWEALYASPRAKLTFDPDNGTHTIRVHSNCWYELRAARVAEPAG